MQTFLDHIAVVAPDLESGVRYVEQTLGVSLQSGGQHPRMGTHNKLLRLGDDVYLEVIAADPAAAAPLRPRWFALDQLKSDALPRLATWIARTNDINAARAACPWDTGPIESMTRGNLAWRITVPTDGSLPAGGATPTLIQWDAEPHPASVLEDRGCMLQSLELFHPTPDRLRDTLNVLGFVGNVQVHPLPSGVPPHLLAHIRTPHGLRTLPADLPTDAMEI